MKDECRLPGVMRGSPPCRDCEERHTACHDKCPKDERGEYGYGTWTEDAKKVKDTRRAYLDESYQIYEEEKRREKWGRTHT